MVIVSGSGSVRVIVIDIVIVTVTVTVIVVLADVRCCSRSRSPSPSRSRSRGAGGRRAALGAAQETWMGPHTLYVYIFHRCPLARREALAALAISANMHERRLQSAQ